MDNALNKPDIAKNSLESDASKLITDFLSEHKTKSESKPHVFEPDPDRQKADLDKILGSITLTDKSKDSENAGHVDEQTFKESKDDFLKVDRAKLSEQELDKSAAKVIHYIQKSGSFGNDFQKQQIIDEFRKSSEFNSAEELEKKVNEGLQKSGSPLRIGASEAPLVTYTTPSRIVEEDAGELAVVRFRHEPPTVAFRRDCKLSLTDKSTKFQEDEASYSIGSQTYRGKFNHLDALRNADKESFLESLSLPERSTRPYEY